MKIKHIFFGVCASGLFFSQQAQAQNENGILKDLSIEAGYGFNAAFSPNKNISVGDYSGFHSFHAGLRYDINGIWGVRGTVGFAKFEDKNNSDLGLKQTSLMLEATYAILQATQSTENNNPFELTAHAGLGLAKAKSNSLSGSDMMGNFQVGVMPSYAFSSQLSLFLDVAYHLNFNQDYGYNGLGIDQTSGSYLTTNLGLVVKLGK